MLSTNCKFSDILARWSTKCQGVSDILVRWSTNCKFSDILARWSTKCQEVSDILARWSTKCQGSVISWPTGLPSVRRSVISWPTGLPSVRRSVKPSVQRWGLVHEEAGQSQGSDHRSFWTETKHKLKNSLNLCTVHKYVWLLYLS